MPWEKTPPEVLAAFEAAAPKDPRVEIRPMFGYRALFLNGNMFAGTFRDRIVVRLGDAERAKLKEIEPFAPMPGRPMKEYVVVPAAAVKQPRQLASWIDKAHQNARSLPAKQKAAPKRASTSRTATARSASAKGGPAKKR